MQILAVDSGVDPPARAGRANGIKVAITLAHISGSSSMPQKPSPDIASTIPVTYSSDSSWSMSWLIPSWHSSQVTVLAEQASGVDYQEIKMLTLSLGHRRNLLGHTSTQHQHPNIQATGPWRSCSRRRAGSPHIHQHLLLQGKLQRAEPPLVCQ